MNLWFCAFQSLYKFYNRNEDEILQTAKQKSERVKEWHLVLGNIIIVSRFVPFIATVS